MGEASEELKAAGAEGAWTDEGEGWSELAPPLPPGGSPRSLLCTELGPSAYPSDTLDVPYAMRWLGARLPGLAGDAASSADRLHLLSRLCARRASAASAAGDDPMRSLWLRRMARASIECAASHCKLGRHRAALRELDALLAEQPRCVEGWRQAAFAQLLAGDRPAAERSLTRAVEVAEGKGLGEEGGLIDDDAGGLAGAFGPARSYGNSGGMLFTGSGRLRVPSFSPSFGFAPLPVANPPAAQVETHAKALMLLLKRSFAAASLEYAGLLAAPETDPVAVGNGALCAAYQQRLEAAAAQLEEAFRRDGERLTIEPLIQTLAQLYEMGATPKFQRAKRELAAWAASNAPDDFDLSYTRVP